jgi:hypothetical protein
MTTGHLKRRGIIINYSLSPFKFGVLGAGERLYKKSDRRERQVKEKKMLKDRKEKKGSEKERKRKEEMKGQFLSDKRVED